MKVKESEIQSQILDYLEAMGYCVWRNFIGPIIHSRGGKQIFCKNKNAGQPDILGISKRKPGVLFGIEVKTKTGKVEDAQHEWIRKMNRAGAFVFVARDLETVMKNMVDL